MLVVTSNCTCTNTLVLVVISNCTGAQEVDGGADVGSEGERSKSGGRSVSVLVVPYDIRYPKIRIRTHLCHELRNHR